MSQAPRLDLSVIVPFGAGGDADIATRNDRDDPELRKRYVFVVANLAYAVPLVLLAVNKGPAAIWAGVLVVILIIDWLKSDTLSPSA